MKVVIFVFSFLILFSSCDSKDNDDITLYGDCENNLEERCSSDDKAILICNDNTWVLLEECNTNLGEYCRLIVSTKTYSCTDQDSGDTGNSGNSGNTGNTGDSGNTGNSGDTGNTGNSGDTGNTASDDDVGDTGDTGNSGSDEDKDEIALDEDAGNSGNSGSDDDSSDTGDTSSDDDIGNTGDTGNTGNTGDSGDSGDNCGTADCEGLPDNAEWNTVSSINQSWNGSECSPSVVGLYNEDASSIECRFKCSENHLWNGLNKCVSTQGMVFVSEGSFWMGCNSVNDSQCQSNEKPYHEVTLSAYYIDIYEVTASQYQACIDAEFCPDDLNAISYVGQTGKENYPVCVNVSVAFC